MSWKCFDVSMVGQVAHVQLSRPAELNTMTRDFWQELPAIAEELSDGGEARALVLSSSGKHFTAGMDLSVFTEGGLAGGDATEIGRRRLGMRETVLAFQEPFNALERARIPVIAAVQGGCIGGGVDMIAACDFRYCSADAFFCIQEINLGLTADVGTLQRLPKIGPEGVVRELAYTGQRMPAERAREVGLVNEVFEDHESLVKGALEVAGEIAEKSPLAIWGTKEMLNYSRDHTVAEGLNYISVWQSGMFHGGDMQEAFLAKQEKRAPRYPDLPKARKKI